VELLEVLLLAVAILLPLLVALLHQLLLVVQLLPLLLTSGKSVPSVSALHPVVVEHQLQLSPVSTLLLEPPLPTAIATHLLNLQAPNHAILVHAHLVLLLQLLHHPLQLLALVAVEQLAQFQVPATVTLIVLTTEIAAQI